METGVLAFSFLTDFVLDYEETYTNAVVNSNHPDPGVVKGKDGSFVVVSTSNFAVKDEDGAFPILTSTNLYTWTQQGYVFPKGKF